MANNILSHVYFFRYFNIIILKFYSVFNCAFDRFMRIDIFFLYSYMMAKLGVLGMGHDKCYELNHLMVASLTLLQNIKKTQSRERE